MTSYPQEKIASAFTLLVITTSSQHTTNTSLGPQTMVLNHNFNKSTTRQDKHASSVLSAQVIAFGERLHDMLVILVELIA